MFNFIRELFLKNSQVKVFTKIESGLVKNRVLVVHHHLGLGDVISLFGLVFQLQQMFPLAMIHLPVKKQYLASVEFLYSFLNPNFKIFIVDPSNVDEEKNQINQYAQKIGANILRVGFDCLKFPFHYDMFFEQIGIDSNTSWDNFPVIEDHLESIAFYNSIYSGKDYSLVINHNSEGVYELSGLNLNENIIYFHVNNFATGIFSWVTVIKNAANIHTVGTAAFHLIDHMKINPNTQLIFHNVRHDISTVTPRHSWRVIDYPSDFPSAYS